MSFFSRFGFGSSSIDIKSDWGRTPAKSVRPTRAPWVPTLVFGYGSLISASGVNGRGMFREYVEADLTECTLSGYRRSMNGGWGDRRFFSISPAVGGSVCGVVFPISQWDWPALKRSEGGDLIYEYVDVSASLDKTFGAGARVLACVVKRPQYHGRVPSYYVKTCERGLRQRSPEFQQKFGKVRDYLNLNR